MRSIQKVIFSLLVLAALRPDGGDGNCTYYNSPNGDSVMVGDGC